MSLRHPPPSPPTHDVGGDGRSNQRRRERSRSRDRDVRERENRLRTNELEDNTPSTAGSTCNCFDCQQLANAEPDRDWSVRYPGQTKQAVVDLLRVLDESMHDEGASSPSDHQSSGPHFADDAVFSPVEPLLCQNACEYAPASPRDEVEAATEDISDESSDEAWVGENVGVEMGRVAGENLKSGFA